MTVAQPMPRMAMAATSRTALLVNVVAFQFGWFACILGAAHGWPWAGTAIAAAIVARHVLGAARPAEETKLVLCAVALGALCDSALVILGLLNFASGTFIAGAAPNWILGMWALFATTLNVSLNWLKGRWLVAAWLGAAGGPLSYWAGARLGAVALVEPVPALAALAVCWAIAMPLLMVCARRYDGIHDSQ